jgi:hypothetical protein
MFAFRYLDARAPTTVYLPCDQPRLQPGAPPPPRARFQLLPFPGSGSGSSSRAREARGTHDAVLMGYLSRERCAEACRALGDAAAGPVPLPLQDAMHVAQLYRAPLVVELARYCDLETRQEVCDAFFARTPGAEGSGEGGGGGGAVSSNAVFFLE